MTAGMTSVTLIPRNRIDWFVTISFVYTALQVQNIDASEKFYTSVLGMREGVRKKSMRPKARCASSSQEATPWSSTATRVPFTKGNNLDHLAFEVQTAVDF